MLFTAEDALIRRDMERRKATPTTKSGKSHPKIGQPRGRTASYRLHHTVVAAPRL